MDCSELLAISAAAILQADPAIWRVDPPVGTNVLEKEQPPAMLSAMSWTVRREGSTLHVTITPPVQDWSPLLARLIEEVDLVGGVTMITLPIELPFTDARDKTTLNALWAIFMDQGIAIYRSSPAL
jgi:hypothetical protein